MALFPVVPLLGTAGGVAGAAAKLVLCAYLCVCLLFEVEGRGELWIV